MSADLPACFAFSMAKCGSTMMNRALAIINAELNIPETNLPGKYFRAGVPETEWKKFDVSDVIVDGLMHRGFRYMPENIAKMPLLKTRKSVLLLRDARDAATSHYFSKVHEHPAPGGGKGELADQFERERQATAERGLEAHVVLRTERIVSNWKKYLRALPRDPALLRVYRYEDVVFSKAEWLRDVYDFFGIPVEDAVIAKAVAEVDVFPEQENVKARARKVTPGDHAEKLSPKVVEVLNRVGRDYLVANGYLAA